MFEAKQPNTELRLKRKMPINSGIYVFRVKVIKFSPFMFQFNFDSAREGDGITINVTNPRYVGWHLNNLLIFTIDTNLRTITYSVIRVTEDADEDENKEKVIKEYDYTNRNPLEISILMNTGDIVYLDYFGKLDKI
jgi:hypothetical protein